jgi:hypothetical protein
MYRKLVFVLTMFAVAFGSLSQVHAALATPRPVAQVASAAHAWTPTSIVTHSAMGAVQAATATRQMAHRARPRTEERQGSRPLGRGRRATETASAPEITSAASLAVPKNTRVGLPVSRACQITTADSATFDVGQAGTFTVTTTGHPTCKLPPPLTLPSGVTFTDNGDGTATLAGTPAANTGGTYQFTINATNDVIPDATQNFTLTVNQAPGITSPAGTTFTAGQDGTFTVTTSGVPNSALSETGALPPGVTFTDNGDGTAALAGTPAANTGGTYPFTITATNGVDPAATQPFVLTVNQACQITSADHATFHVGQAGAFAVATTGVPNCGLLESGNLPSGVTFTDNGNGTATISGTPTTGGVYPLQIIAGNGIGGNATQALTLIVLQAPGITSPAGTTFTAGQAGTFTVTTSGVPTPGLSEKGALPREVKFTDNGDGTATLAGTPAPSTGGTYTFRIAAKNGVSPAAIQSFTLIVVGIPAAPSGLKATSRGRTVSLTWTNHASAPSAATTIWIQRSTNARFTTAVTNTVVGPNVTSHRETVVAGKRYYYRVRAHNAVGFSRWSNTASR